MTGTFHIHKTNVYRKVFELEENCKEKIISEDYWDFIIPLYRDEELKELNPENACIQEMDFGYKKCICKTEGFCFHYRLENIGTIRSQNVIHFWYAAVRCAGYYIAELSDTSADGDGIMIGF